MNLLIKKTIQVFIIIIILLNGIALTAQINYHIERPVLTPELIAHKQYKRAADYALNRDAANIVNPDWFRWQEWEKLQRSDSREKTLNQWQNFGPANVSGRIISIAFHPTDSNIIYGGSAGGGLWKTVDYGAHWTPLTDFLPSLAIGAIAINPKNPDRILIATGEGYSLLTEFSSGIGVLSSNDGGQTFALTSLTAALSQNFAGMDIYWSSTDTNKVCVATSFGVYFSADGGSTFTYTLERLPSRMISDPAHPDTLYLAARYYNDNIPGGFFRSVNAGQSWTQIGSGLPNGNVFGYASIAIHPAFSNKMLLNISKSLLEGVGPMKGLYQSNNYGLTWTPVNTGVDLHCYPPPAQNVCQGWFANTICYSPDDPNVIFAGGTRLWKSVNGGQNWSLIDTTQQGTAALHVDHHQTLYHPLTGDLFDVNDGGINYSSDGGGSWTSISDGLITHQFYTLVSAQTDPEVVIGGAQDVGFFSNLQAHDTPTWDNSINGDAFGSAIDFTNENIWYTTSFAKYRRIKSINAGLNWALINNGTSDHDQWRMPMVMHPENPSVLLSSNDYFMYKTVDGGVTWQTTANTGYISCFEFDKTNPNLVYAAQLHGGTVYRSVDGGSSWTALGSSPGSPITDLAADPSQLGVVYASVGSFDSQNQVFKSMNGGNTWVNISNNFPPIPATTLCVNPFNSNILYVGADLGVWKTEDGGDNWELMNNASLPYVAIGDIHYYQPDSTIRVGTYGRGYWKIKDLEQLPTAGQETSDAGEMQLFPNPANDEVNVVFPGDEKVENIKLYNIAGQLEQTNFAPTFSISRLPVGIYFALIQTDRKMYIRKLVKR